MDLKQRRQIIDYILSIQHPVYYKHKKVVKAKKAATGVKSGGAEKAIKVPGAMERVTGGIHRITQETLNPAYVKKGEASEAELNFKPDNELMALYKSLGEKEQQQEEQERFFNKPSANADFGHWGKMALWDSINESVPLAFSKNPKVVDWDGVRPLRGVSAFAANYEKLRELVTRAILAGQLPKIAKPQAFAKWAESVGYEMPDELMEKIPLSAKPAPASKSPQPMAEDESVSSEILKMIYQLVEDFKDCPEYKKHGEKTQQQHIRDWLKAKKVPDHYVRVTKELITEQYSIKTARRK